MSDSEWLQPVKARDSCALRLVCIPYAGGGASVFKDWPNALQDYVELIAVELPGRGRRFSERPLDDLQLVVGGLTAALRNQLDLPYVIFGHSLGSLIAFELVRELRRRRAPMPQLLVVSGARAPHLPPRHQYHKLPEAQFIETIRDYNGTPPAVLANRELMQLFLPVLRADFAVAEAYAHVPMTPLDVPIDALGGIDDPGVPEHELREWRRHTRRGFDLELFEGDHFFLHNAGKSPLIERLRHKLAVLRTLADGSAMSSYSTGLR